MRRYGNIIKLISAKIEYGRLAQLVEHLLDVQEVTGSSPVPSTTKILRRLSEDFLFGGHRTRTGRAHGLRLPASATALERAVHPAGRGPNSSSLLLPQAAVVAVAVSNH